MTQDVDPAVVAEAGRVYGRVYDAAGAAVHKLAGVLKGSAGMGGTDNAGHGWCLKYDALVGGRAGGAGLMEAASATVMGAAQESDLLATTAVNHQNADQQSALNNAGAPAFPPTAKPMFLVPSIPSAEGGHGDVPGWWHTIEAYVEGEMWPNGHQDKLRAAADAWHTAAGELRAAADIANDGVIGSIRAQKSPEFQMAATNATIVRDSLKSIADGFDSAGKACSDYAQAIDTAHSKILHEMAELGITVAVTEFVAAVLIPFTVGASECVSKVVDVARLAATGARIATIVREFRVAAEASSLPAVSAAGAAARAVAELSPLLAARAQLFLAEGAGCMGYRLEITRQPINPDLTRSERRSWKLHRELARHLTRSTLTQWQPTIERNLRQLRSGVSGQPHLRNLDRWGSLVKLGDVPGLHRVLTGLSRDCIEMREVSPMPGLLTDEERSQVLRSVH